MIVRCHYSLPLLHITPCFSCPHIYLCLHTAPLFLYFWHCHPHILNEIVFTLVLLVFHCMLPGLHKPHPFAAHGHVKTCV